jgi:hypothetical protein
VEVVTAANKEVTVDMKAGMKKQGRPLGSTKNKGSE